MILSKSAWLAAITALFLPTALGAQGLSVGTPPPQQDRAAQPKKEGWRPNVLFILCDQLNVRMLGHEDNGYGGLTQSLTPNIDALASGGVRFTNASTVSAICQASRYSILTGRWPYHHGVRTNGIWEPQIETTFPELAQIAEYQTANLGLHHLWWLLQEGEFSADHGFEENLDLADYAQYCADHGQPTYNAPSNIWSMPNLPVYGQFESTGYTYNTNEFHPTGYFADEAIRFLNERAGPQGDGEPFVCWYSMISPHTPILPSGAPSEDWAHLYHPYDQLTLPPNFDKIATTQRLAFTQSQFTGLSESQFREALSYYYAMVSQLDWNIGRVLNELDQLGIADDTLVVFTADHGEMSCEMSSWTKGAGNYDALTRVPLIMRLPGVLPSGRTIAEPVLNIDIFPTMVEITGVPADEDIRNGVDGESLVDLMVEPTAPVGWRQLAFHALGTTEEYSQHHFMARTPTAKYTYDEMDGAEEFYDLANDPWETTNLVSDSDVGIQAQVTSLKQEFQQWWNDEQGHVPHYKPVGNWNAQPSRPFNPVPAEAEVDVARDVNPRWLPSTAAHRQVAHFGTDPQNLPVWASLPHMANEFNVGTLAPDTTYYWRVDQINGNGTTAGVRWSFTTTATGNGGPGLALSPSPDDLETDTSDEPILSWSPSPDTQSQDLFFGPAGEMMLVASGLPASTASWACNSLTSGVTYQWRIDSQDATGATEGTMWSFQVSPEGLPERTVPLLPTHFDSVGANGNVLSWKASAGSLSYEVYFGTSFPLEFKGNHLSTSWDPGALASNQTYYWRIDSVNRSGKTPGWTSRFSR